MTQDLGSAPEQVDVVVIGLGPGGEHLATEAARAGLRVVGVERRLVGGECPYYGCIPSKMMIRAAGTLAEARRVPGLAGTVHVEPDWAPVARRIRDEATDDWDDTAAVDRLVEAGVTFLRGTAQLRAPGTVRVATAEGERTLHARHAVVLNTGTEPAVPPIEGLAGTPYWTNREAVAATEVPRSLAVVGGGAIGVELAQTFARFGAEVTVLEGGPRILGPEEPEAAEVVRTALEADGITVHAGVRIDRVAHDGRFTIRLDGDGAPGEVTADALLVAAGRRSNLAGIGLDAVGLDPDARSVDVDERMRAGERLWAIGDITGKGAFTHVSMYQADIALHDILAAAVSEGGGETAAEGGGMVADYRGLSHVTFTDPEVGAVGLTEQQARDAGVAVRTAVTDLAASSRGFLHGPGPDGSANAGLVKVVLDADRDVLVGATTVGPSGGEMIGLLAAAVHAEIPLPTLNRMHFAYPSFHRAIQTALADLG